MKQPEDQPPSQTDDSHNPEQKGTSIKSKISDRHRQFLQSFWFVVLMGFLSLVGGVVGGFIGWQALSNPFQQETKGQQVVIEESSAITEVVKNVSPSVVAIKTTQQTAGFFGSSRRAGAATGIVISKDGLILTNKHVIPQGVEEITVSNSEGKTFDNARVIARDPLNDIAYIQVEANNLKPIELGNSDGVKVGQRVIAVGNALGEFPNTATYGIVSGIGRPVTAGAGSDIERLQDLIQTDAAINPGNSGGPLVNIQGQLIGVTTAVAGNAENIGFAIPINQIKSGIESVQKEGRLIKPYLGVRYINITKEFAEANDLPVDHGAYVVGGNQQPAVLPDSPADKAGLQTKDIITAVEGAQIKQTQSLVTLINRHQVGKTVTLTVLRDGKERQIDVTLEELPQEVF